MFLVRRLLLITAVFFFKSAPYLQFLSMYGLTMPFIFLLIAKPPLLTPLMNRLELYNELIILCCTCLLIGFTDYSTDAPTRDTLGWLFIGLAASIIAVTAVAILFELAASLHAKWLAWRENQAAKKYDLSASLATREATEEPGRLRTEQEKASAVFDRELTSAAKTVIEGSPVLGRMKSLRLEIGGEELIAKRKEREEGKRRALKELNQKY